MIRRLGTRSLDDEGKISRWKNIVNRFKGKLIKLIKDSDNKFDDYSILLKIGQILLHCRYELNNKLKNNLNKEIN